MDFALGAEEMVEKLTDKNLELEEKIEQYEETIQDLVVYAFKIFVKKMFYDYIH